MDQNIVMQVYAINVPNIKWTCECGFPVCRHLLEEDCSSLNVRLEIRWKGYTLNVWQISRHIWIYKQFSETLDMTESYSFRQGMLVSWFFPDQRLVSWSFRCQKPASSFFQCHRETPAFLLVLGPWSIKYKINELIRILSSDTQRICPQQLSKFSVSWNVWTSSLTHKAPSKSNPQDTFDLAWLAGTESYSPMLADGIYILGQFNFCRKILSVSNFDW